MQRISVAEEFVDVFWSRY